MWKQGNRKIFYIGIPVNSHRVPEQGKWNFTTRVWFGIPIVSDFYEIYVNGTNSKNQELLFLRSGFVPIDKETSSNSS
jgi:hypothetical protein